MACSAVSYPDSATEFVDQVNSDIKAFLSKKPNDSVLVFPPVNSYFRFLIHQLAEHNFVNELRTFSVGEEPDRRIVVCTRELVDRLESKEYVPQQKVKVVAESSTSLCQPKMVVENGEQANQIPVKKTRPALPTIGIYRPPAARKSIEDASKQSGTVSSAEPAPQTKEPAKPARGRVRRPDLQVYVPRARRLAEEPVKNDDISRPQVDTGTSRPLANQGGEPLPNESSRARSNLILDDRKSSKRRSSSPTGTPVSLPPRASQLVETKKKVCQSSSLSDLDCEGEEGNSVREHRQSVMPPVGKMGAPTPSANLPPRAEVLVEKKKKLCQSDSLTDEFKLKLENSASDKVSDSASEATSTSSHADRREALSLMNKKFQKSPVGRVSEGACASVISKVTNASEVVKEDSTVNRSVEDDNNCDIDMSLNSESRKNVHTPTSNFKSAREANDPEKCDRDADASDDDYQDTDNGGKRNGLSEMSDRSSGSNESLSSADSLNSPVIPVQLMKPVKSNTAKTSPSKPASTFNPDECDWDALIDEDGECLDPFLMKELTEVVGQVRVSQPQSDYRNYRSQAPADPYKTRRPTSDDDFGHVVEIHSFPREFKTNDLVAVFMPFKNAGGGFEIKWVDDTHALGVFASSLIADQVLEYNHPMVRTRPLSEASLESRLKARRLAESIQSFRPRPETCAALARRLVTGALGVRLATARQEREEEKRVLQEAREKRKLAAKQRDDIWNSE